MVLIHKIVLYGLLGLVGISLLIPGLMELLKLEPGNPGFMLISADAKNQFRALYAMMAGVGIMSLWACMDLESARKLVLSLGVIMAITVCARGYSIFVDGMPRAISQLYLFIETVFALVFLLWPPPA
tara:strand:- start:4562 stop:4942 length:381 start_codon:yes stop_codon:yes gene_type:complete